MIFANIFFQTHTTTIGRVPLIVPVEKLSEDELVRILHEPKNSLVEQYTKLFQTWNIHLEFTNDALHSIAKRVLDRHTGARGLKFAMVTNAFK